MAATCKVTYRCFKWEVLVNGLNRASVVSRIIDDNRWDEKAGLRRDAVRSQVIDVLEAQEIKETGNEEG